VSSPAYKSLLAQELIKIYNACTLLLGNPTRSSGFFFYTHHRQAGEWWTRKVSCVDSPRVSDQYVREMSIRYGDQSNAYRVRVLGEFPVTDESIAKMGSQESGTTCYENFFCLHFLP
ncbi:MAG: hypothetical protein P8J55_12230, partial [Pseudomonadales bacterium]|nr:hypothetical protein [Pseudomonadales bacterium]